MTEILPLFPLHAVLLPGAGLGLRVFERRYLDLVRDCGRSGRGFGICLILEGEEAGQPAVPAAYGTEAMIEDFDTGPDGLLALRVRGARRFRVIRTRVRDNGLVTGEVQWCEPDPDDELQPQHGLLATLLQSLLEQAGADLARITPAQMDSAAWVGWRLAELLPLTVQQRAMLLQEDNPHARLDRLLAAIA
ncbi:LON peptidase substrate-binding domain-containing protein [Pseudoxanthomonas sp. z9]|uniref:LON peptidase substrate-binding domain-containing protein n=1 Tax=Pseudoxanthomonas sp. z9 TaxID=2584942 RepID=UPI0011433E59|nr:LON peptidase substrate-binding domain-containing protein [Pseudoxanthomonas sp. z9]MCL6713626.1 LON peptidase substrate-binding domain-containing protein [Pseudomonas sp. R2.Fl]